MWKWCACMPLTWPSSCLNIAGCHSCSRVWIAVGTRWYQDSKFGSKTTSGTVLVKHLFMLRLLLVMFKWWFMSCVFQGLSLIDEFLKELSNFDQEMESQRKAAEVSGEVSRMELFILVFLPILSWVLWWIELFMSLELNFFALACRSCGM